MLEGEGKGGIGAKKRGEKFSEEGAILARQIILHSQGERDMELLIIVQTKTSRLAEPMSKQGV